MHLLTVMDQVGEDDLSNKISQLKEEILNLKLSLLEKETELTQLLRSAETSPPGEQLGLEISNSKLTATEIARYSRQMLVPQIGVKGQLKLKGGSVLIVGVGGLGCPAALFLAAAGVGRIGLVDYDCVEINNLHRQVLHSDVFLNQPKVDSAFAALRRLNKEVQIDTYKVQLSSSNATDIVSKYDVVVDATDNVPTRFLLNDVCIFTKKPLVSGAALKLEGQLTVYNYQNGPCYRCLFPKPPPASAVQNCGDAGVLGPVPGIIGTLQAIEVIKILTEQSNVLSRKMLVYDAFEASFRTFKIRDRSKSCAICSESPTVHHLVDYEQLCGSTANDKSPSICLLESSERVSVEELAQILEKPENNVFIDVRSAEEFEMCNLPKFINVPMEKLKFSVTAKQLSDELSLSCSNNLYVVCRRGNDSQRAVQILKKFYGEDHKIRDVIGGIHAWTKNVDASFPIY